MAAAQACHVSIYAEKAWNLSDDHYLILLDGGKSEYDLTVLYDRLTGWCAPEIAHENPLDENEYVVFVEPDLNDEHTAIAIKPGRHPQWITHLPLWKGGESHV